MKIKTFDRFLDEQGAASCGCGDSCCGPAPAERAQEGPRPGSKPWMTGLASTAAGDVPIVASKWRLRDRLETWRVRWSFGRMSYTVPAGLYGIGKPDSYSPVFVTANFKLTFDRLRRDLQGIDGWILVLDTKGINVWCAAGKGTFGTEELVHRIESSGLAKIVSHRTLILPQLGAPGVAAHEVAKRTKFRVVYGPVRSEDIPAFMNAGMKTTPEMRLVRFDFRDRIVLTPVEIAGVLTNKYMWGVFALWLAGRLGVHFLAFDGLALLGAIIVGAVLVPALLPWIPGRAFSFKGWLLGAIWIAAIFLLRGLPGTTAAGWTTAAAYALILPSFSAFLAMNFTGTSTITSLSGVVKEMRTAVPLMLVSAALGTAAFIASAFLRA